MKAQSWWALRMFPPRERGWSLHGRARRWRSCVSPARAGMVLRRSVKGEAASGFPRASGDGPGGCERKGHASRFPPRERGWSLRYCKRRSEHRVSPARAGMVPMHFCLLFLFTSFPRASGDGPHRYWVKCCVSPFPPRERGWSIYRPQGRRSLVVSPARAGMVLSPCTVPRHRVGFPRASGDGPYTLTQIFWGA